MNTKVGSVSIRMNNSPVVVHSILFHKLVTVVDRLGAQSWELAPEIGSGDGRAGHSLVVIFHGRRSHHEGSAAERARLGPGDVEEPIGRARRWGQRQGWERHRRGRTRRFPDNATRSESNTDTATPPPPQRTIPLHSTLADAAASAARDDALPLNCGVYIPHVVFYLC